MRFVAQPDVFSRIPGVRIVVVVAAGLDMMVARPAVEEAWRAAWRAAGAAASYGNAQSHPRVAPWRARWQALGISGKQFPSSIEATLRRALKGGDPYQINPLVDFYNTISLRHFVPAGAFDLADLHDPIEVRLTRPGDQFQALDEPEPIATPPGEIAYADGATILTRHFVWRQSRVGLVTPATTSAIFVSEVLGELGVGAAEQVRRDIGDGLRAWFDVESRGMVVTADAPTFAW